MIFLISAVSFDTLEAAAPGARVILCVCGGGGGGGMGGVKRIEIQSETDWIFSNAHTARNWPILFTLSAI